jgi:predicted alpha/beta-hydrolase family hydrolase
MTRTTESKMVRIPVTDHSDPELEGFESMAKRKPKEAKMAEEVVVELKEVVVTGPIVIKGVSHDAGDTVMLTEEEYATLTAVGAPVEGVEPKTPEQVQADHEAGVEAQKARIEEDAKEKEEAEAK